ncbi:MAG: CvpA family protein [Gammaproteobacteria bacterium]|nr:CvpA family protein [Gammaproteobacteria bacterium]MCP4473978.1 CvpA family protein [Gammaproteobacteria bacterium]
MKEIFTQLNVLDYVLLAIAFLSLLVGLKRGFVREVMSLLIWVVALIVAVMFTGALAHKMSAYFHPQWIAEFVSFIILLVVVLIVGKIVGGLLTGAIGHIGMGPVNHLLGAILGLLRGAIIAALIVFILSHTFWEESKWFKGSQFAHRLLAVTHWSYREVIDQQSKYAKKKADQKQTTSSHSASSHGDSSHTKSN